MALWPDTKSGRKAGASVINWWLIATVVCSLVSGCGDDSTTPAEAFSEQAPATVVNRSRNIPPTDDFLRLIFLKPTDPDPVTLGRSTSYRVFFGNTEFYEPPIYLTDVLNYSGIPYAAGRDLIAFRCLPEATGAAEPMLATWPNMFKAMNEDFAANPPQNVYETALAGIAADFAEVQSISASETLANMLTFGAQVFVDADNPGCAANSQVNCPQTSTMTYRFGAYPAFSGLGLAIANTSTSPVLDSQAVLVQAVIPEYILKNVSLAAADCRCIRVPDYAGRETARLNPNLVLNAGARGACNTIDHL
ncbi:MAG TPA: hypothetical protein VMD75_08030 [Candidatus Binataceae bacterium]|nr:hypothetical protein [Candidatus Binataceae bacterium]